MGERRCPGLVEGPWRTISSPETVFEGRYVLGREAVGRNYDIAPDGQRFLMFKTVAQAGEGFSGRLVVVQHWFEKLRRLVPTN